MKHIWKKHWIDTVASLSPPYHHDYDHTMWWKNRGKIVSSPDHGNHFDFQQISVILPTFWTLPWYGHSLEICWKYHGNLLEVEISMIFRRHDFSSDNACYKKRIAGFLWVGYLLFVASKKNLCLFSFISS